MLEHALRAVHRQIQSPRIQPALLVLGKITWTALGCVGQQNGAGHAHVQALDEAAHGHPHPGVARRHEILGNAVVFVAEGQRKSRNVFEILGEELTLGAGRNQGVPLLLERRDAWLRLPEGTDVEPALGAPGHGFDRHELVLALVGVVPVLAVIVARSNWARQWAVKETGRILQSQGLSAQYELKTHFWPISAELAQVRLDSIDGGAPALVCDRILVRPRLFALLAGKLVVDQVEIDSPQIRVVLDGDRITNLGFDLPKSDKTKAPGPWTAPFDVLSVTDARLDLDVRGVAAQVDHLDLDVNVDVPSRGADAVFEISSHLSEARVRTKRQLTRTEKKERTTIAASFEDSLCDVTARLRIERKSVLVRRLSAKGYADVDPSGTNYGACPPSDDALSYVDLQLNHFSVQLPIPEGKVPTLAGQFSVRAPLALVMRADDTPKTGGWVGA